MSQSERDISLGWMVLTLCRPTDFEAESVPAFRKVRISALGPLQPGSFFLSDEDEKPDSQKYVVESGTNALCASLLWPSSMARAWPPCIPGTKHGSESMGWLVPDRHAPEARHGRESMGRLVPGRHAPVMTKPISCGRAAWLRGTAELAI